MKLAGNWTVLCGILVVLVASCTEPPQYSLIPEIEFDKVILVDVKDQSLDDSLIVSIRFKDGDGDMGLDPTELNDPYVDKYYFRFADGTYVTYKSKRTVPGLDTLPGFVKPFNCTNWEIKTVNAKLDTFYFELNPNHYNIFVDYYIKNADGSDKQFDWTTEFANYPNCGITFDGRFPILSKDLSHAVPLEGTIRYAMVSAGFNILFSIKTLRLGITIQDRKLNKSNTVFSQYFRLDDIRKSGG